MSLVLDIWYEDRTMRFDRGDGATNNDNDTRSDNRVEGFPGFYRVAPRALIVGTPMVSLETVHG